MKHMKRVCDMSLNNKVTIPNVISQVAGNLLLLVEEGLSRLYPREPRKQLSEANFRYNRENDIQNTIINDQASGYETGVNKLKIGKADMGSCGCEVIAVYNALALLDKKCSIAETERAFELDGAMTKVPFVPIGKYGSNPYALKRMTESFGLNAEKVSKKQLLNEKGLYIFSYWNYGGLMKGLHTITAKNDGQSFILYNYANKGDTVISPYEWDERFWKRFIIGYRITEKENT